MLAHLLLIPDEDHIDNHKERVNKISIFDALL